MTLMAVLLGGALGSAARHGVNVAAIRWLGTATPYATAAVNLAGSLVIGVLAGALAGNRLTLGVTERAFIFTGLLGGFTTFSSLMLDSLVLTQEGAGSRSIVNLAVQIVLGLLFVYAGYRLGFRASAE